MNGCFTSGTFKKTCFIAFLAASRGFTPKYRPKSFSCTPDATTTLYDRWLSSISFGIFYYNVYV